MVSVSMGGRPAAEELYKALSEREYIDSTALENGVAIPHAKMEGLERPVIAIARSRKGCDFDSHDKMPTHLFFILLAPSGAFSEHIKLLARLAKVLSVKGLKEKLLEAPTLENIYMCLAEAEKKL
jgi:mannitol/fructose-specific phosphotransferase system IIA component (Ntr-type)